MREAGVNERGGVLLRLPETEEGLGLALVPMEVASRLVSLGPVTALAGPEPPAWGVALAEGEVVSVLDVRLAGGSLRGAISRPASAGRAEPRPNPERAGGRDWPLPGSDRAILCLVDGEPVAITGATIVATGVFAAWEGEEDAVDWRGQRVPLLDVRLAYARAEAAVLARRAARVAAARRQA